MQMCQPTSNHGRSTIKKLNIGIIQGPRMMTIFLSIKSVDATDVPEWCLVI